MAEMQISKFRANLAECVNKVAYGNELIMVERSGKPLFAVVSVADMKLLESLRKGTGVTSGKRPPRRKS